MLVLTACSSQTSAGHQAPPTNPSSSPNSLPSQTATGKLARPATPLAESYFEGVRVTYITNAGFLITAGDQRILIDAIYEGNPEGTLKPILNSQPPFDGVDLILTTHVHYDHFDPELVLQYLQNNPETLFASTPRAVDAILALDNSLRPRLTAIELQAGESEHLTLANIDVEVLHLAHGSTGAGILNLGYIITLGNVKLFHMGDMNPDAVSISDLQAYTFPEKQIDIAFVHYRLFSEKRFHAYITEGIQARYLIPMHFGSSSLLNLESDFPEAIVLTQPYENWELPN